MSRGPCLGQGRGVIGPLARLLGLLAALIDTERYATAHGLDTVSYTFTSPWPALPGTPVCTVMVWTNNNPLARVNVDYTSVYLTDEGPWYAPDYGPCADVGYPEIRANVIANNAD
jgi:hypothetical protein